MRSSSMGGGNVEAGDVQSGRRVDDGMESVEVAVDAIAFGGKIAFELFADDFGAAGADVFDARGWKHHLVAGIAREIIGVDAFADAEDGEDFVEETVAVV